MAQTIEELLAEWDTPEERERIRKAYAEWDAKPCKYGKWDRECWTHGYLPPRPCGHSCYGAYHNRPCPRCRPLTGRQKTRARWRRQGRR